MDLKRLGELAGINFIHPQIAVDHLGGRFSESELSNLEEIPIFEEKLSSLDTQGKASPGATIAESHIFYPIPSCTKIQEPFTVHHLIKCFGFFDPTKRICFTDIRLRYSKSKIGGWEKWFQGSGQANHPLYQVSHSRWLMLRKVPIAVGEDLTRAMALLQEGQEIPTLLEVLVGIISYYFSAMNYLKTDEDLGIQFYESRDGFARLLSGRTVWTSDVYSDGSPIVVGLNTPPAGNIFIDIKSERKSGLTGLVTIQRLDH